LKDAFNVHVADKLGNIGSTRAGNYKKIKMIMTAPWKMSWFRSPDSKTSACPVGIRLRR
jgi:hypothetical protein